MGSVWRILARSTAAGRRFIELSGIEWSVVTVTDGEGVGVCSRMYEDVPSAQKVLGEGHFALRLK